MIKIPNLQNGGSNWPHPTYSSSSSKILKLPPKSTLLTTFRQVFWQLLKISAPGYKVYQLKLRYFGERGQFDPPFCGWGLRQSAMHDFTHCWYNKSLTRRSVAQRCCVDARVSYPVSPSQVHWQTLLGPSHTLRTISHTKDQQRGMLPLCMFS